MQGAPPRPDQPAALEREGEAVAEARLPEAMHGRLLVGPVRPLQVVPGRPGGMMGSGTCYIQNSFKAVFPIRLLDADDDEDDTCFDSAGICIEDGWNGAGMC